MVTIFTFCVCVIFMYCLCIIFCRKQEHFNDNIFAFNPYVTPPSPEIKDKMLLPTKNNTGDIHKWEKRFPFLVGQRYSYNDKYDNNCYNGDYMFRESTYNLADKALLTELPLKLSPIFKDSDFVESKYLYGEHDVCPKIIDNYDEKYKNYGPFVSDERNIKYRAYEPTYFDYLDVIY